MTPLRVGTRGSQLALWQARTVAARLVEAGGPPCELVVIRTSGDRLAEASLSEVGGKRLFVKEIEDALLRGEVDLAVHSAKDLPAELPRDLAVVAALPREDPRDAVVLPAGSAAPTGVGDLPARLEGRRLGTSSVRRVTQLAHVLPGARFEAIRGNLDTRLRKLDEGQADALVLASAGLNRLGFAHRISMALPVEICVPAPGQGIVAIEIREADDRVRAVVARIDDAPSRTALEAERALVEALGGGCQLPLGAVAQRVGDAPDLIELQAVVMSLDGRRAARARERGRADDARTLGRRAAAALLQAGAGPILAEARGAGSR